MLLGAQLFCRWATVLPIDAAKTRLQTATPGSPRDVGIVQNIRMMYREGEALPFGAYQTNIQQPLHATKGIQLGCSLPIILCTRFQEWVLDKATYIPGM